MAYLFWHHASERKKSVLDRFIGFSVVLILFITVGPIPLAAQEPAVAPATAAQAVTYTIQLVPFTERVEAQAELNRLTAKGYQASIHESADDQARTWFAVRIGHYPNQREARQALVDFKQSERVPAFITPTSDLAPIGPDAGPDPASQRDRTVAAQIPPASDESITVTAAPAVHTAESSMPLQKAPVSGPKDLQDLRQQLENLNQKVGNLEQEAEARKILRMSEEEQTDRQKEILSAAGREYTLIPKGRLGVEYNLQYDYMSSDVLEDLRNGEGSRLTAERRGSHTLTNTILLEAGLLDNLTVNGSVPYVYKYDTWGQEDERQVTDLGDAGLGLQYQPFKAGSSGLSVIANLSGTFPSGRSPYKINPDEDLATGSGCYSTSAGMTFSKTLDPVVAFGNLNYTWRFPTSDADQRQSNGRILTEVDPSDSLGFSLGMGYALTHKTSLNLSYQYAFHFGTDYEFSDGASADSGTWVSSIVSIGAGWRLNPKYSLFVRTDIGLTNDDPDFSFSLRIPVQFDLGE